MVSRIVGNLQYYPEFVLGSGAFAIVYRGKIADIPVAVKRIPDFAHGVDEREVDAFRRLDHPNVVKCFGMEADSDFRYS